MDIIKTKLALAHTSLQHWLLYELFTWNWWVKITALIIAVIVWYKFANRKRINEIILYGLLVSLICLTLDIIGTYYVLWEYPIRLLPLNFSEIHDFIILPIIFMLIYQRYTHWKSFIISNIIMSFLLSFIGENIAIWLNFYKEIAWKHIYSFPIYFIIAIVCKFITNKLSISNRIDQ